jgi:hypothetical protein
MMHGEIHVKSESGRGSVFTLELPAEVPHELPDPAPTPRGELALTQGGRS